MQSVHTYKIIEELIVGLSSGNKELPKDFSYLLTEIDEDRCKMNDEDITIICDDLSYKGSSVLTELKMKVCMRILKRMMKRVSNLSMISKRFQIM